MLTKSTNVDVASSLSNCNVSRRSSLTRVMAGGVAVSVLRWTLGAPGGGSDVAEEEDDEDGAGGGSSRAPSSPTSTRSRRRNVASRNVFGLEKSKLPDAGYSKYSPFAGDAFSIKCTVRTRPLRARFCADRPFANSTRNWCDIIVCARAASASRCCVVLGTCCDEMSHSASALAPMAIKNMAA